MFGRKHKHIAKNPNERKEGSPGYDQERAFDWIIGCQPNVYSYTWLSEHEKTKFDFVVWINEPVNVYNPHSVGDQILIDVVSCTPQHTSIRLFTNHKDFYELMDYAKERKAKACYLAFCIDETDIEDIRSWRFLRIHDDMPHGDIYISKSRAHGLRKFEYIFGDKRRIKTIIREKTKYKYKLRKKAEDELMAWIYG